MCKINKAFKLCTCHSDLKEEEADWILFKVRPQSSKYKILGMVAFQFLPEEIGKNKNLICQALNLRNCFDFDYQPQNEDLLHIKCRMEQEHILIFEYTNGKWVSRDYGSLDHVKFSLGKLKVNI